jgi:hypothetical protein
LIAKDVENRKLYVEVVYFKKKKSNKSVNWKYKESSTQGFNYKFYILIVGKRKFTIARTTFSQSLRISLIFTYTHINLVFHRTGALWNPSPFSNESFCHNSYHLHFIPPAIEHLYERTIQQNCKETKPAFFRSSNI